MQHTIARMLTFSSLIIFLVGCVPQSSEKYIDNAKEHLTRQDKASAIIELKNALQKDPTQTAPRLMLGEIYLNMGEYLNAQKELQLAQQYGAPAQQYELLLARAYLSTEDGSKVIELVNRSTIMKPEHRQQMLAILSLAQLGLAQVEQATHSYNQAAKLGEPLLYTHIAKAKLQAEQKQLSNAIQTAIFATTKNNHNSDAWILLGHLHRLNQDFYQAAIAYRKATELSPSATHLQLYYAQSLVYARELATAEPIVDALLNIYPSHTHLNELKASIRYGLSDERTAGEHARLAMQNGSRNNSTLIISGVTAYQQHQYEVAYESLSLVVPFLDKQHFAHRYYVSTLFELGELQQAEDYLKQLSTTLSHEEFIVDMSLQFRRIGRMDLSTELLTAAQEFAQTPRSQAQIALAKLSSGDLSTLNDLKQLSKDNPELQQAQLGVIYYHLAKQEYNQAITQTQGWLANEPSNAKVYVIRGVIEQRQQHYTQAQKLYQQALDIEPNNLLAQQAFATLYIEQGELEKGYQLLTQLAKQHPSNFRVAKGLFTVAYQLDKQNEALSLYRQYAKSPLMLARAYTVNQQFDQAITILEAISPNDHNTDSYALLTRLYEHQKNYQHSEATAQKWLEYDSVNTNAYHQLIAMQWARKNYSAALNTIQRASQVFPNDARYTLLQSRIYLAQQQPKQALNTLNSRKNWYQLAIERDELKAMIYSSLHDHQQALKLRKAIFEQQPNVKTATALTYSYVNTEQTVVAIALLNELIEEKIPEYQSLQLLVAQLQRQLTPNQAMNHYHAILKQEQNNLIALNNLAWLYFTSDLSQACKYASQAYQLAKQLPHVQDTYGYCLLKKGEFEQANHLIYKAYQALPYEPEIALHYAESLLHNRQVSISKNVLDKITPKNERQTALKQRLIEQVNNATAISF